MAVWLIARKEMRDALRTRWFALGAAGFALLVAGLALLSGAQTAYAGEALFGRTAAGLVNLVLLVIPLLGLTAGALSLAGERERGTLSYLLAQPVDSGQVYLGKYLGLAGALCATVLAGFGLGGVVLAVRGSPLTGAAYGWLALLTVLLALVSLAVGCLISVVADRVVTALGAALFIWLLLVFLGDLGLMATAVVTNLGIRAVFAVSLINPLQVFRAAAVGLLQPSLEVLGPVGAYAGSLLGPALVPAFAALLFIWVITPLGVGYALFYRRL